MIKKIKLKKTIRQRWWLYIGAVSAVIVIASSGGEDKKDYQTINSENQQNQASLSQNTQNNFSQEENGQPIEDTEKQELLFKVIAVTDGDTIKLENGEVVRYIGIDTPETIHPSRPVQCFGKEASDRNKELVEGKLVKLEKDIRDKDKYGRLLRYVWVGELFVNDYLARQGYAYAHTFPPNVKHSEQFVQAQQEARKNNRGLWAGCPDQKAVEGMSIPFTEVTLPGREIICSHNVYNCSDFSSHAEAQGVFEHCGGASNDIHHLDADKNGLACESLL